MNDPSKTNQELISELASLRQRIAELEQSESRHERSEEALRKHLLYLHTIIDTTKDGFGIFTRDGMIIEANEAICSMLECARSELLGKRIFDIIFKEDIAITTHRLNRCMTGQPEIFESSHLRKDGSTSYTEISLNYLSHYEGQYFFFCRDITERRRMEKELRENELKLRNLANNLSNAVIYQLTVESDGGRRFTYISRAVERLNEVTQEDVLADAGVIYGQVLPEYHSMVREREEEALKNLTTMHVEVQSRLPSGRLRWFEYTSTPRHQADGLLVWDGVQVDVTGRKIAENL